MAICFGGGATGIYTPPFQTAAFSFLKGQIFSCRGVCTYVPTRDDAARKKVCADSGFYVGCHKNCRDSLRYRFSRSEEVGLISSILNHSKNILGINLGGGGKNWSLPPNRRLQGYIYGRVFCGFFDRDIPVVCLSLSDLFSDTERNFISFTIDRNYYTACWPVVLYS